MKNYVTIVGAKYYYGMHIFKIGMKLELRKNEDNEYDDEAIEVYTEWDKHVGNVSNSVYTRAKGTHSAGMIHHTFEKKTYAIVRFIIDDSVIAEIVDQ